MLTTNGSPSTLESFPSPRATSAGPAGQPSRPEALGKYLYVDGAKLFVRGVTYGAFRPGADGDEYHDLAQIDRDFADMAANGFNAVRIPHTMPPRRLLDLAQRHGLRVMVGLSAEQYVGYIMDGRDMREVADLVRPKVRIAAGHPALLCYAIGNEIPAPVARWMGRRTVERYLELVYHIVKHEDPRGLVTYVNYPTTEYLQLPFLDLVCFNVYLERQDRLAAYLTRLQNIADDRPLVMSEVGLDSLRHGESRQAEVLDWQIRTAFEAGCAGTFIFSWTDEWYRAGADVDDWRFGLTTVDRQPKPALAAVRRALADIPVANGRPWPAISVVVCSYNGGRTIRRCLEALSNLEYPHYEVIVVDDGSTDDTAAIAGGFACRVIRTENRGLSSARNTGLAAATGPIVAYIDDDAYPDPHWLTFLATTFGTTDYVGVGGPNIAPPDAGPVAQCVDSAPGGPVHVLIGDTEAEHIPGCNMAFRRECLEAIGGFDPRFRTAGDDVDVCWRLQERGWKIGFNAAAMVWHHRRDTVRGYWTQQVGYGVAEGILERKWPEKYNLAGHPTWVGRIYGMGFARLLSGGGRIYHGPWGTAPFQSLYQPAPSLLRSLPMMPEWYMVVVVLAGLTALGVLWEPLWLVLPLLLFAAGVPVAEAVLTAVRAPFRETAEGEPVGWQRRALTAALHLMQPAARLYGRLQSGLAPWRLGHDAFVCPNPRRWAVWCDEWRLGDARLRAVHDALRAAGVSTACGGEYDEWDLETQGGLLGRARLLLAAEEHPSSTQLVRLRLWPRWTRAGVVLTAIFAALAVGAAIDHHWIVALILAAGAVGLGARGVQESGAAMAALLSAIGPKAGGSP